MVARALDDPSRDVRASAVRIAERWLGEPDHPIRGAVVKRLDDADWAVRHQVAASIGALPAGPREDAMVVVLERHGSDPIAMDAALSGLRGTEVVVLDKLLQSSGGQTSQRDAAIAMLAATVMRGGQESAVQSIFGWAAADARAPWQRSALLRGAEIALLGAAMPGTPVTRRTNVAGAGPAPCPTCPGGRAGPGGAYALRTQEDIAANAAATGGGRGGGRLLRLNGQPVALSALAARGDETSPRAASVLARVTWPGKPGDAAPVRPMTVDEQKRFDAGREIYRNICQACHQPDGRGQDRLAPTLIGSALTLAAPDIPARILLNGKEGPVGLMPPVGSVLSDDQMAAVLTYVRREWGQPGTPVEPATVASVRKLTTTRTRPWTDQELIAIAERRGERRD